MKVVLTGINSPHHLHHTHTPVPDVGEVCWGWDSVGWARMLHELVDRPVDNWLLDSFRATATQYIQLILGP